MNWTSRITSLILQIFFVVLQTSCATAIHVSGDAREVNTFRRAYANSHLVNLGDEKYIMIDSGGYDQAPSLDEDIKERGIHPNSILAIVLTHGHWDHAAGAKYFQDKYGTPVIAGKGDQSLLDTGHADKLCPTSFFAKLRVEDDSKVQFISPRVTHWIEKPTRLKEILGVDGILVPLPSHTPGSIALILGRNAFVGDLFRGGIIGSNPELHFYICDVEGNKQQIQKFLTHQAKNVEHFFTEHFGPSFSYSEVKSAF